MGEGLYTDAVENAIEYKNLTWEEIKELLTQDEVDYWDRWDEWWSTRSLAFQEEFDRIMRIKVEEYCDESTD